MGILRRSTVKGDSRIRVKHVRDTTQTTLQAEVRATVQPGSEVMTDRAGGYRGLSPEFAHQWVDHTVAYAEGRIHNNGVENFWSLFDRMYVGTYTHVDPSTCKPM